MRANLLANATAASLGGLRLRMSISQGDARPLLPTACLITAVAPDTSTARKASSPACDDAEPRGSAMKAIPGVLELANQEQAAACYALHEIEARLAHCLLHASEMLQSDSIPFTQEIIAENSGLAGSTFPCRQRRRADGPDIRPNDLHSQHAARLTSFRTKTITELHSSAPQSFGNFREQSNRLSF